MGRISTAAKPQKRDAETKLAQSRLSVLGLAKELGNVAEACRQRGPAWPPSEKTWRSHGKTFRIEASTVGAPSR